MVRSVQTLLAGRTRLTDTQKRAILRSVVTRIDVEAVRAQVGFARAKDGRIQGSGGHPWRIERVTIRLALSPGQPLTTISR